MFTVVFGELVLTDWLESGTGDCTDGCVPVWFSAELFVSGLTVDSTVLLSLLLPPLVAGGAVVELSAGLVTAELADEVCFLEVDK